MNSSQSEAKSHSEQWQTRFNALRNFPPVLKMVWQSGPLVVSSSLGLRFLAASLPIAMLTISKSIIDAIAGVARGQHLPHLFPYWVGAEFLLAAFGGVASRAIGYCDTLLSDRFSLFLSVRILNHASRLDLFSYEDPAFQDKLERARVQANDRVGMVQATGALLQQVILAVGLCVSLAWFSPWLVVILFFCSVPAFFGESHFAFLGYSQNIGQTPARREMDYLRILGSSKESAKELKLFGLADFFVSRFRELFNGIYRQNVTLGRRRLLAGAFFSLLTTCGYYGSYIYVIVLAVHGRVSVGSVAFVAGALAGASASLQAIFSSFSTIADQALFLTDLVDFFAVKPKITSRENALPGPRPIRDGYRFENVSFAYPGSSRTIIDGIDMHLAPGERLAVVGMNGAGKTTLVKLLVRLYDPTRGRILLDGIDLREYDIDSLHESTSVIFQDFVHYDMTARENIAVGRIGSITGSHPSDGIELAAALSHADAAIQRLPRGMDQMLGRRFDGGVDLSGGEWQKVALARAYLRDAQLLILDEPAAALDARAEFEVFERFASITEGKMAVLISHRFSTVRMSDRIVVLEGGRIIEEGSHDALIARGGQYASMFELQASSYR